MRTRVPYKNQEIRPCWLPDYFEPSCCCRGRLFWAVVYLNHNFNHRKCRTVILKVTWVCGFDRQNLLRHILCYCVNYRFLSHNHRRYRCSDQYAPALVQIDPINSVSFFCNCNAAFSCILEMKYVIVIKNHPRAKYCTKQVQLIFWQGWVSDRNLFSGLISRCEALQIFKITFSINLMRGANRSASWICGTRHLDGFLRPCHKA